MGHPASRTKAVRTQFQKRSGTWIRSNSIGIILIVASTVLVLSAGLSIFTGWGQASAPSLPELHPTSLVLTPTSPVDKGVAVVARAKIVNTGGSPAPRFTIEFFYRLRTDRPRPWTSFPDGKGVVVLAQGLSPRDQTVTVEGIFDTAKAETEPGNYEIRVLIDAGNQISEQDETNNELIVGLQVHPSRLNRPDLLSTALLFNPPSPVDGETTVNVMATVRNSGPVDAGAFDVQYLFCKLPTSRSICPADQLVEFARAAVPAGLTAGEERSGGGLHGQTEIQFPNPRDPSVGKLDAGTYLIQVRVDPTSKEQPNGAVEEQDEANNTLTALFTVKGPELYPESIVVTPTLVRAGDEVLVTTNIANSGTASAENVAVAFFIDGRRFATVTTSVPAAASTGNAATDPSAHQTVQASLKTAELVLQPGVHELRVVVDPDDQISELDESNNTLATSLTLQMALPKLPELAPKSLIVTPSSPIEQGTGTVTAEILNNGTRIAEAFDIEFAIREAGRLRWNPITCTVNCRNNKLNPNGELTAQAQLPALVPGSYEVRVLIDPQERIPELDEKNNEMVISFRMITARKPDLAIVQLAFDPPSLVVLPGQPARVLITVENIGDAPAGPSAVQCSYRRVDEFISTQFQRVPVPSLLGQRVTVECHLETSGLRPGFYELATAIEFEDDEQNKANNFATSGTGVPGDPSSIGQALLIQGPDLIPDRATLKIIPVTTTESLPPGPPTPRVSKGDVLDLEITVRNRGAIAAGGFEVAFCLRALPSQLACTEIGTRSRTTGLGLADEFVAKSQLNTQLLVSGLYEIGVIVDPVEQGRPFGRVDEINERNNNIGGAPIGGVPGFFIEVGGGGLVDLAVQTLTTTPSQVTRGQVVRVSAVISNLGVATSGPFQVEFSYHNLLSSLGTDPVFSRQTISNLDGGTRITLIADLNTLSLSPGTYEISVVADQENRITEPDKINNRMVVFLTVN